MSQTLDALPRLSTPGVLNALQYWLRPENFMSRCGQLGDRFLVPMPATGPWLCLTHPDDLQAVFTAPTDVLRLGAAIRRLAPHDLILGPTSMTSADGEDHRRKRQMCLPPFQVRALAGYEAVMRSKTEEILKTWPMGSQVRAHPLMQQLTLEVILAAVFGVTDPTRLSRVREAVLSLADELGSLRFSAQTLLATTREDGWDRPFRRMHRVIDGVDAVVMEEIQERRAAGVVDGRPDVLSLFLQARDADGAPMTDAELCDGMRTLLIAGHDTTAGTLAWCLEALAHEPQVLSRTEQAVDSGDDDYVDAVIKEVMRLRPVVPITARYAAEPYQLADLEVPAGTMIIPFVALVHRRPDVYPRPGEMRPERFVGTRPGTYTWIPFGGGQRRCLGAAFSLFEARVVLATMLQHARLEPSEGAREGTGRKSITVVPSRGATITLQPR